MNKSTFLIAGKHAVTEALRNPNRRVLKVFLTEDSKKKLNRGNQPSNLLKNVDVVYKTRKELNNLCSKEELAHQGYIAEVEQLEEIPLKEYILSSKKENINLE